MASDQAAQVVQTTQTAQAAQPAPSLSNWIVPYCLILLVFYFLVFRPKKEEQKKRQETLGNLKRNDQVVTSGGIHGTVLNVKDKTVIIRIDDNVKIEVDKEAVVTVVKAS